MLGVADLPAILRAALCGVTAVVDNTFATPMLQQPLALGARYVVRSRDEVHRRTPTCDGRGLRRTARPAAHRRVAPAIELAIPGVMEAYLALRGLRTLPVRFARQQRTAAELAERLDDHRHVARVRYPGLVTDRRLLNAPVLRWAASAAMSPSR